MRFIRVSISFAGKNRLAYRNGHFLSGLQKKDDSPPPIPSAHLLPGRIHDVKSRNIWDPVDFRIS